MTSYELEDELISRTLDNLRAVEKLSQEDKSVYEVTQLINSLLGLLVYPKERLRKIPEITWETMIKEGWPLPTGEKAQVKDLKKLIWNMRNAVAHFNIELITNENGIEGIRFKNYSSSDKDREKPLWIGEYRLEPLKRFVYMFLDHISKNKPLR
jgi:hypothetical protein